MDMQCKKQEFVSDIIYFVTNYPYNVKECADYAFLKKLDEKTYLFDDVKLNGILNTLIAMTAGEEWEFSLSQDKVLDMLRNL